MARSRSSSESHKRRHKKHKKSGHKSKKHKSHRPKSFHFQSTESDRVVQTMKAESGGQYINRPGLEYGRKDIYKHLRTEAFTRSLKYLNSAAGGFFNNVKK